MDCGEDGEPGVEVEGLGGGFPLVEELFVDFLKLKKLIELGGHVMGSFKFKIIDLNRCWEIQNLWRSGELENLNFNF